MDDDDYYGGSGRQPSCMQQGETAMEPTFVPIFLLSPDRKNEVVREIA